MSLSELTAIRNDFPVGTGIDTIHVPPELRIRIDSGRSYIDGVLGGGMAPSQTILLTGMPGAGKTSMMLDLASSMHGQGHLAVFNTGEESLFQIKIHAERLECRHNFMVGDEVEIPKLLRELDAIRARPEFADKRFLLIFDSLQVALDGKYGVGHGMTSKTALRSTVMITNWCKKTLSTAFIIGQVNKDGKFKGKNEIRHVVDTHMELRVDTDNRSDTFGQRILTTSKNRFGPSGTEYYLYLRDGRRFEVVSHTSMA